MMTTFSSLFNLSLVILSFHLSFASQNPLCLDDEQSALLQFKESLAFDELFCNISTNYTKLSSWEVGDDCCSWDGIHCDAETGHVIGLDLSSSCLYVSINSSSPLFRLAHLKSLDLSFNNFNLSRIPGGVWNLAKLTDLNLSSSHFVGQIPSEILELSNLVSLDLSLNSLMLQNPSLKDFEAFTRLDKLHLSDVTISSPVARSFTNLTSLSYLLLANCSLLGEFPPGVFRLPNLRVLSLQNNTNLAGYLPEFDHVSSPLQELWLDGTSFSGQVPASIGNLESLEVFTAAKCHFSGVIPSSVGNLTNLDTLDLSGNYFSGEIPSSLCNLFQLTNLDLSDNNFSNGTLNWVGTLTNLQTLHMTKTNTFGPIPSSLGNLTRLTGLFLDKNSLTGQITSWMCNLTQLTHLSISYNELQGPIPELIYRLPNLQLLHLDHNNLSGSLKSDSFLQMQHLFDIRLSYNHLSLVSNPYSNGTLPKLQFVGINECNLREFPDFLRGQYEIELLGLSGNNIAGFVPSWFFTLKGLRFLSLNNNSLTGFDHPLGILSLANLQLVYLDDNQFEGPLPVPSPSIVIFSSKQNKVSGHISPLFCNLKSVLLLDVSNNNLSGTLPPCLGSDAIVLNLRNNSLSGAIHDKFSSGCKLKLMDFSQNMFTGKVPNSLARCSQLEILNLDENRMCDVFPSWLGILPNLRILKLRSNHFHGVIGQPLTKFDFSHLQIIDNSSNNFRAKLPLKYFQNWVAMKNVNESHLAYMKAYMNLEVPGFAWRLNYTYPIRIVSKGTDRAYDQIPELFTVIDLSSNRFKGEVPEVVGSLIALQSLNLSNNILIGHIPSSLGNLTMLEALDLSLNDLSGRIPVQLTFITFLAIFNVSHNSLTGPIPQGNQFDTFDNSSFSANPGLCGDILSKKCGITKSSPLPPSKSDEEDDESPFQFNWEIMLIGCAIGLTIGVAFGCALDTHKYEWLVKKTFARRVRTRRTT